MIAYIAPHSPFPLDFGKRFRVAAIYQALQALDEVRLLVLGERPSRDVRVELRRCDARIYPPRMENAAQKLLRYASAAVRGRCITAASFLSPRPIKRLVANLAGMRPDVIILGDAYLAELVPHLRPLGARLIVDTHNVESDLHARIARVTRHPVLKLRHTLLSRNIRHIEQRYLPLADEVWTVSEQDAQQYRDRLGLMTPIIPNVVDLERYEMSLEPPAQEQTRIVFTGLMNYWPNVDASLRLIAHSRRLLAEGIAHRLYLVGRDPSRRLVRAVRGLDQVVLTGQVPDVRPYVAGAGVFAAPLYAGGGTKLKVIEAMALGRPVLTTSIGAEGLGGAVIADHPDRFYEELRSLLSSPARRRELGSAGRAWVERHCSMECLTRRLEAALSQRVHVD